jgi:hypothetical protein
MHNLKKMGEEKEGRLIELPNVTPGEVADCVTHPPVVKGKAQGDDNEGISGIITPSPFMIKVQLVCPNSGFEKIL